MAKTNPSEAINALILNYDSSLVEQVNALRSIVLASHPEIQEQVKWNSPSFFYAGDLPAFDPKTYKRDLLVVHLRKNKMLLIFPTGNLINDPEKILTGDYSDGRRMIEIKDMRHLQTIKTQLTSLVINWINTI